MGIGSDRRREAKRREEEGSIGRDRKERMKLKCWGRD